MALKFSAIISPPRIHPLKLALMDSTLPVEGLENNAWTIDLGQLKVGTALELGDFWGLFGGRYRGEDVAIKILENRGIRNRARASGSAANATPTSYRTFVNGARWVVFNVKHVHSFVFGFAFPPLWYYATFLYFGNYYIKDPRERAGLAASAIAALICSVAILISLLAVFC
ncbi:hypothetical protein HHK36_012781 [Tetracentron sinense]|uniref:Uncharacterized protein n=1 Tax=Tetracentron sinense TaxID=13715 RepID=A0A834Z9B8_TETSI|nr:hypothetical protein HHK36_012781 [Tetracentron sinense]